MSKTIYVEFRNTGCWVDDLVSSVFLKFLIDAARLEVAGAPDHWLAASIERWRVNAVISDFGFHLDADWTQSHVNTIIKLCRASTREIRKRREFSMAQIQSWSIHDDYRISTCGQDPVPGEPVARFGDAVVALLEFDLPRPPTGQWWFFTLGEEIETIAIRRDV